MSKEMAQYTENIQKRVDECYDIAKKARELGFDPEEFIESPQAKDLAGRVEKLVGPRGVAEIIRDLKSKGKSDDQIAFQVVSDILDRKIGNIEDLNERVDRAIRVGLAIQTMGVVSAPLEGISKITIRNDYQGKKYLSLYFAGPIRAAGGTTQGLCVLIADFVRKKSGIPKYEATDGEAGRYVEEIKLYDRRVHLQYPSSNDEIRFAVAHIPIEINGDATEDEEVSRFRDLPRVETNNIRGGACLVLNDGILLKAPKLLKRANNMELEGWDWLEDLEKIAHGDSSKEEREETDGDEIKEEILSPNSKYIADIIAGRPVFSYPSRIGGHRIRYGRSRNTGLAAGGLHPATMVLLDKFIAIGTQLRIERPGKSTSICPVSSIEPPIVKLKNGDVVKVKTMELAEKIFPELKKILFLGDILFGYGEFAENNHNLLPSGYVEEWWALELKNEIEKNKLDDPDLKLYVDDPFSNIPKATQAIEISKRFEIPLHPAYTDFWGNISPNELKKLHGAMRKAYSKTDGKIQLKNEKNIKKILEKAFIVHKVKDDKIYFSKAMDFVYEEIFNLKDINKIDSNDYDNIYSYFHKLSGIKVKNKAPYYMGSRMGRPEKSERKSMKGIHTLFPLSDKVGNSRLIEKAIELRKVKIDVCRKQCPNCGKITIFNKCPNCNSHTELQKICTNPNCRKLSPTSYDLCPQCQSRLTYSEEALFNIKKYVRKVTDSLNLPLPEKMKGIFGLTNRYKVPEPIEKGILRAKNGVLVYKTAEIRYDATDIPLTHFKPREIEISLQKLKSLGYTHDCEGKPLQSLDQIVELKVQDVILSNDSADYLVKVAHFLDDELNLFYHMSRYYNIKSKQDLIGHLVVGLAPHTSAGIIGRIIGFSHARSIYAHPFWHAAKRRNCDGDEDSVMLLLDPLLNFSRHYLPSKIGGRMDATLVIGTLLDPKEIDTEAQNVDTLFQYPIEFYEATERFASPNEIEKIMEIVKDRLGKEEQYEKIGYNIPTDDINAGPTMTAYKLHESMDEKIEAQLHLAKIIKSVEAKEVAKKILSSHFNPDILGNLRKFALQEFRCVKCNTKYRRPPLSNSGKCSKCGGNVILTVNRGGIEKYIPRALKLCKDFRLDDYTYQRMELIEEYVTSLTNNPRIKQQKLSDFF
ncbi:MAG: DNA polymerase II large subunit [Promethearchaeia archaeon]